MFWYWSSYDSFISHSGWGLSRMMVWRGFAVTLGWNTFFLLLATVILKLRTWEALPRKGAIRMGIVVSGEAKRWLTHGFANLSLSLLLIWLSKTGLPRTISVKLRASLNQLRDLFSIQFTDNVTHNTHHEFHMGFNFFFLNPSKKKTARVEANCWNFPYPLFPSGLCNASWI